MSTLLAVGTIAFDSIETPFGKADKIIGGSVNYIAWSACHLCDCVEVSAVVGGDYPQDEIKQLINFGADFTGLQVKEEEKTFFWSGKYHMNLNDRDTLTTDLNVLKDFDPILPESYLDSEFVMLGNLTPSVQIKVLDQLNKRPSLVAMDTMNYWIQRQEYREDLLAILARVDVLIINDEEARMLGNHYSLVKCAKLIMNEMGPKFVIIKKGENGALLFYKEQVYFAPALPLEEVFDPTGAGDTFAGGFMGYLAQSRDTSFENLKRAVIFGSTMASFCVEDFGPNRLKHLHGEEIEERVQEFLQLVQVDIELKD